MYAIRILSPFLRSPETGEAVWQFGPPLEHREGTGEAVTSDFIPSRGYTAIVLFFGPARKDDVANSYLGAACCRALRREGSHSSFTLFWAPDKVVLR